MTLTPGTHTTLGSSPRKRGTRNFTDDAFGIERIIPAQAGNTSFRCYGDHPRASGEHGGEIGQHHDGTGPSPRKRGTPENADDDASQNGIIPAQAGNTRGRLTTTISGWDHPRASGEHFIPVSRVARRQGSSPRKRGTPISPSSPRLPGRIIPAQAGNTITSAILSSSEKDHPRASGEHAAMYE